MRTKQVTILFLLFLTFSLLSCANENNGDKYIRTILKHDKSQKNKSNSIFSNETVGLLSYKKKFTGIILIGINVKSLYGKHITSDLFTNGTLHKLMGTRYGVVLSKSLAEKWLGIKGETLKKHILEKQIYLTIIVPVMKTTIVGTMPRYRRFKLVGLFKDASSIEHIGVIINKKDIKKLCINRCN